MSKITNFFKLKYDKKDTDQQHSEHIFNFSDPNGEKLPESFEIINKNDDKCCNEKYEDRLFYDKPNQPAISFPKTHKIERLILIGIQRIHGLNMIFLATQRFVSFANNIQVLYLKNAHLRLLGLMIGTMQRSRFLFTKKAIGITQIKFDF